MKKVVIFAGMIAGFSALAYGLFAFYKKQISNALNYCYKISGIKFNKVSKNDIDIDLKVKVRNNSDFILNLTGYNLNILINNVVIANVISNTPQTISNKTVSELTMNIRFDPLKFWKESDALALVVYATTNRKMFMVQVKGSISAKMNFIAISNLPIDIQMSLAEILAPAAPTQGAGVQDGQPTQKCVV